MYDVSVRASALMLQKTLIKAAKKTLEALRCVGGYRRYGGERESSNEKILTKVGARRLCLRVR